MTKTINSFYVSLTWIVIWIVASLVASLFLFLLDQFRFLEGDFLQILLREVLVPGFFAYYGLKTGKSAFGKSYNYLILVICFGMVYSLWHFGLLHWLLPAGEGLLLWSLASTFIGFTISLIEIINLQKENKDDPDLNYSNF